MKTLMTREEYDCRIQALSVEQKKQLQVIRDRREDKLRDQRNVMLRVTMTFLGVSIPLCSKEGYCHLMKTAIASACITTFMLFIAQRKLTRQMGETIYKYPLLANKSDRIDSTTKLYEEICIKCWWVPFFITVGSCLLAVFY